MAQNTRFIFDLQYLDNCFTDKVEFQAEIAGYMRTSEKDLPDYGFFLDFLGEDGQGIPPALITGASGRGMMFGNIQLYYDKASILFLPVSSWDEFHTQTEAVIKKSKALYVRGEFVKGNARTLQNYGITIAGER